MTFTHTKCEFEHCYVKEQSLNPMQARVYESGPLLISLSLQGGAVIDYGLPCFSNQSAISPTLRSTQSG